MYLINALNAVETKGADLRDSTANLEGYFPRMSMQINKVATLLT